MAKVFVGDAPPKPTQIEIKNTREELQVTAGKVGFGMATLTAVWVGWRWGVTLVVLILLVSWVRKAGELGRRLKELMETK